VLARLAKEVAIAMASPFVAERLGPQAFIPTTSTPAEFTKYIDKETTNYARIVKDAHIQID
jgi:tripartite-type tricarboxylate transporter receptor subunit TctC